MTHRHSPYAIYCTYTPASSQGDFVQGALRTMAVSAVQSATLSGTRVSALADLDGFYQSASRPNWDGEGALAVKKQAYSNARRFISLMPRWWSKPDITGDPDGEVSIEWQVAPRRRLSVSVGPDERLSYAWLIGSERGHGTDTFGDEIPAGVLSQVNRLVEV